MDNHEKIKYKFKVIRTQRFYDRVVKYEYEGNVQELCVELEQYLGGGIISNRRVMEKQLARYEQQHQDIHFEMYNMQSKRWKILHGNKL